jgi:hypothetical protein
MPKRVSHPFTISIQTRPWMQGRFHWAIRRGGYIVREGSGTYSTFEEARLDGKGALDGLIVRWAHKAGAKQLEGAV